MKETVSNRGRRRGTSIGASGWLSKERSGLSAQRFCKEQGLSEQSFYVWRKRLRNQQPRRFALVERGWGQRRPDTEAALELVLATGERLRISAGVDPKVLRAVLEVLRA